MTNNSFFQLDDELPLFKQDRDSFQEDYMQGRDISWVAQVAPFIDQFSQEGDCILDPFAGLGTTLLGASYLGRNAIGIELEANRIEAMQKRVELYKDSLRGKVEFLQGNALELDYPAEIDLIVTNPPYFYKDTSLQADNIYSASDYTVYMQKIEEVLIKCERSLRKGGYILVFSQNIRLPNGCMIPLAYDISRLLSKHFVLKEERMVVYKKESQQMADPALTNRAHEYVYVAKKKNKELRMDEYLNFLQKVEEYGVPYVIIGSFSLYFREEGKMLDTFPADLDILVPFETNVLIQMVQLLRFQGFTLSLWGEPFADVDIKKMAGKYFIRGRKGDYTIDINYESDVLDFESSHANSDNIERKQLISVDDFLKLILARGNRDDLALAERLVVR